MYDDNFRTIGCLFSDHGKEWFWGFQGSRFVCCRIFTSHCFITPFRCVHHYSDAYNEESLAKRRHNFVSATSDKWWLALDQTISIHLAITHRHQAHTLLTDWLHCRWDEMRLIWILCNSEELSVNKGEDEVKMDDGTKSLRRVRRLQKVEQSSQAPSEARRGVERSSKQSCPRWKPPDEALSLAELHLEANIFVLFPIVVRLLRFSFFFFL